MACELDDPNLSSHAKDPNDDEHWVLQNVREDVRFIVNHSSVDHVEQSQKNKDVEHHCVQSCKLLFNSSIWSHGFLDEVASIDNEEENDRNLEQ